MPYVVNIEYQSTFDNYYKNELMYFIKRVDTNNNISCSLKGITPIDSSNIESLKLPDELLNYTEGYIEDGSGETFKQEIAKGEFKAASDEQVITFNFKMMFRDTGDEQDYNKGATFSGKIVINEGKASEIAKGDTAVDTIDKQLITQDNSKYSSKLFTDNTSDSNVRFTTNEFLVNSTSTVSNSNEKYDVKLLDDAADTSTNNVRIYGKDAKIIGIFKVKNATTGVYERLLKIKLYDEDLYAFDTAGKNNDWATSSLMREFNVGNNSLLSKLNGYYTGWNQDDNVYFDPDVDTGGISLTSLIANVEWDIGGLDNLNVSLENAYKYEKGITPYASNKKTWTGRIGLPSLTDYLYNYMLEDCLSDLSTCAMAHSDDLGELTMTKNNTSSVYVVNLVSGYQIDTAMFGALWPTFYLKKGVKFYCGDGTKNSPYRVAEDECLSPS